MRFGITKCKFTVKEVNWVCAFQITKLDDGFERKKKFNA